MTTIELKSNFHRLIDEINNDAVLNQFYEILMSTKDREGGMLWKALSMTEQSELIHTEANSHNEDNLISHYHMKEKNRKWL
jgi:hypothetical protein